MLRIAPSALGTNLRVLKVVQQEKTTLSRSNGCCNGSSSCNNRSHRHHGEMQLLKKGKLVHYGTPEEVLSNKNLSEIYELPIIVNKDERMIKYY